MVSKRKNKNEKRLFTADERMQIMLDALPLCCNIWDKDFVNIDCNQAAVRLFDLTNKQEYLDRFFELSPEYQPDGRLSAEKAGEMITAAFAQGTCIFEWMHQKPNGEPIPSEITLVRVDFKDGGRVVAGYTRDLRELKASLAKMDEANLRTQIMLDATPLCCNFWDEGFNNIDCNQEAVYLFGLADKQEYLSRFNELSPERQPDGRLSSEKALEMITTAFTKGRCVFEWLHQKLNGEPIPSEITLVRANLGGGRQVVLGYTRDLRELKDSIHKRDHLERLAFSDPLTGIYNRRYFMQMAAKAFEENNLDDQLAVIMYDLDHFKRVNDTHGHEAGDEVLKAVSAAVQAKLRTNDLLARFGGEEFVILFSGIDKEKLMERALRLRDTVAKLKLFYMGQPVPITISLGVAFKSRETQTIEELIKHSDIALYRAKGNGRNCAEMY